MILLEILYNFETLLPFAHGKNFIEKYIVRW